MKVKITKYVTGLVLFVLLTAGILISEKEKVKDEIICTKIKTMTQDVDKKIGDSPTLDGIKGAELIVNSWKNSIDETYKSLKESGKLRKDSESETCSETNKCSETTKEFERCRDTSIDQIAGSYDKFQTEVNEDLRKLSNKQDQLIAKPNSNLLRDINAATKTMNEKISLLNEFDTLMSSYISLFKET